MSTTSFGSTHGTRLAAASVLVLALTLSAPTRAATGVPLTLTTNGYLLAEGDLPLTQQDASLGFSVWSDPDSRLDDSRTWPATGESACATAVLNGYYAVVLDGDAASGCGAGLTSEHLPPRQPRYLQVSVNGVRLLPRLRLGTVPTATHAAEADTVGGESPASLHDAAKLTGVAPATVLGTGSTGLTTLGTVATGAWQATPIADAYVASAATWNAKLAGVTRNGTLLGDGTTGTPLAVNVGAAAGTVAAGDDARFGQWSGGTTGLVPATARASLGLGTAATTDASAYATTAQGTKADAALPRAGGTLTGAVTFPGSGIWSASGNVGIGTTSPVGKLDVNGQVRIQGVTVDESFRHDDATYFAPQAYFEAGTFPYSLIAGTAPTFAVQNDTTVPFSRVALSNGILEFAGDYVPVQPGESLTGEFWAMRASGSTGSAGFLYCGVSRFDKDKKPISGNSGLDYFVASGAIVPQTGTWTRYSGATTLPLSHTPFDGSDGGPVRYVRPYVIVNYHSGTIPTYWGGVVLRRVTPFRGAGPVAINGNLGLGTSAPQAKLDVVGNIRLSTVAGGGASLIVPKQVVVGTSAVTISTVGYGGLVVIMGYDTGAGTNQFSDLVFYAYGNAPTVLASKTVVGSPAARTYGASNYNMTLSVGSGSYNVSTTTISN